MRGRSLVVDTNLLVLVVVGLADPRQIERFNRTRAYTREDFERLRSFVNGYEELVTTPNIATETSNLAGQLAEPLRGKALAVLAGLVTLCDERGVRALPAGGVTNHAPTRSIYPDSV